MTDLTTTQNEPLAMTASAECSPGLWKRLTETKPHFQAVDELAADEDLRPVLVEVNDRLQRHVADCGAKAVVALLTPLVTLYGVPDKSQGEWRAFWGFYTEALGDLPLEALKAGISDFVKRADSEFFPKPGPLKALCDEHARPIAMAAHRVRRALETDPREARRRLS